MYKKSNKMTFCVNYAGIFCEDGNSEKNKLALPTYKIMHPRFWGCRRDFAEN